MDRTGALQFPSNAIVFDVNGTLLDIDCLGPGIRRIFGPAFSVRQWFTEALEYSMAMTMSGQYQNFGELLEGVLRMTASARRIEIRPREIERLKKKAMSLPAFPDVRRALHRLKKAGFRLAVLTNSSIESLDRQLKNAGLEKWFEQKISVERVGKYKPAEQTYRSAAEALDIETRGMMMVAAHPWDLMGAAQAGCRTAFIARPGKALFPYAPQPDIAAKDLVEFARRLLKQGYSKDFSGGSFMAYDRSTGRNIAFLSGGLAAGILGSRLLPPLIGAANGFVRARFGQDPFDLLIQDHRRILALLDRMAQEPRDSRARRPSLFLMLKRKLAKHAMAEEDVVYPLVRSQSRDGDQSKHLYDEHADMKVLLFEIEGGLMTGSDWRDPVRALRDLVQRHANQEEQEIFPQLRRNLGHNRAPKISGQIRREEALVL
ncbi:MAG TPA: haloacid dehalogenase type II [Bryobacteraceae bacterium]|nr:haloacid dehalogenase type II [Bryobacteraceae bacterium]